MPKIIYVCEYCGEEFSRLKPCQIHESYCAFNPENKTCATCNYLNLETLIVGSGVVNSEKCAKGLKVSSEVKECEKWKER